MLAAMCITSDTFPMVECITSDTHGSQCVNNNYSKVTVKHISTWKTGEVPKQ